MESQIGLATALSACGRADPRPIEAKWIGSISATIQDVLLGRELAVAIGILPARCEDGQANRDEVAVHEAREYSEYAQAQHPVASTIDGKHGES